MKFPPEFNNLLGQFHQDFLHDITPEKAVESALIYIGKKQREVVKQFLDQLMSAPYDVEEVYRLWWASPSHIAPPDAKSIPTWLKLIRDQIDSPRVQSSSLP